MGDDVAEMWSVTAVLAMHSVAIAATLFLQVPYTKDIWIGDRTIPTGTTKQVGFTYFIWVYCWMWLVIFVILTGATSGPCFANLSGEDAHHESYIAMGVIVLLSVLTLFQHAFVYVFLVVVSSETFAQVNFLSKKVPMLSEFCELFPEPPSLIVGTFTIREDILYVAGFRVS